MPYGFNEDKSKYDLTGKAEAQHEHDAGDITSGALPIARGGTGKGTAKAAQNALLSDMNEVTTAAGDSSYMVGAYTNSSDSSGVLFKRKFSNLWDYIAGKIRSVFGFNSSNILPIANGGTGAANVQNARNNLNVVACSDQENMLASINPLTAANQMWFLAANVTNDTNNTYKDHRVGLLVNNTQLGVYDFTAQGTIYNLYGTKSTIPIANGGTGQTEVTHETTINNIISAASGVSITSAVYSVWGKVAQLNLSVKATSAKSGTWTVGTVAANKRPYAVIFGSTNLAAIEAAELPSAGTIQVNGALAANATVLMTFTYLLP